MCQPDVGVYAVFWHEILYWVNTTNQILQNPKLNLYTEVAALISLET